MEGPKDCAEAECIREEEEGHTDGWGPKEDEGTGLLGKTSPKDVCGKAVKEGGEKSGGTLKEIEWQKGEGIGQCGKEENC
jgi:hypothetical protein